MTKIVIPQVKKHELLDDLAGLVDAGRRMSPRLDMLDCETMLQMADAIEALAAENTRLMTMPEASDPHRFIVVSANYSRPFLLGAYPTLENAVKAQCGSPEKWHIFERYPDMQAKKEDTK